METLQGQRIKYAFKTDEKVVMILENGTKVTITVDPVTDYVYDHPEEDEYEIIVGCCLDVKIDLIVH